MGEHTHDTGDSRTPAADGQSGDPRVERRSKQVFSLLGTETRIGILYALAESPEESVPFAVLCDRVGTRDSGQFNSHPGPRVCHVVRRTEDGYELTVAGSGIVGALRAGRYTASITSVRRNSD
jgi:DNA-binding transcriptional ArsR family regulator